MVFVMGACGPRDSGSGSGTPANAAALVDTSVVPPGCEAVADYISRMPGLEQRSTRAVALEAAWASAGARLACQSAASGHSVNEYASVDSLLGWLRISGWRENTIYSADGPDGTVVGMHNGSMLCIVEGRWDGGDDSDTTVARSDTLDVTATCTAVIAADTAPDRPKNAALSSAAPPAATRGLLRLHGRHGDAQDFVEARVFAIHERVAARLERPLPALAHPAS